MGALTWAVAAVVTDDAGRVLLCRQGRGERRYGLPGGRLRPAESPAHAAVRDIRAETGWEVEVVDLVGLYHLAGACAPAPTSPAPASESGRATSSAGRAGPLPDVLVHVFRARVRGPRPTGDAMGGCRASWHDPTALPEALTPTTRAALADALAGRSGVLRTATPATAVTPAPAPPGPAPPDPVPPAPAPDGLAPDAAAEGDTVPGAIAATPGHPPGQRTNPPTATRH
ncbi:MULTISPECIES: NUDIX domain-containing protein [unclassified Micromonospora]|uniref:NUDIX hydrolase n=1 Tax=unclassified Micromonospora TaxID=2617518 RepID=UPI00331D6AAC